MEKYKDKHIKIVKPLKGLTFFYQPIYKKWKNYKFKELTIIDKYQYEFLNSFKTNIITDKWIKLKFTKTGDVYIVSLYDSVNKTYNDNTGNIAGLCNVDKNLKYNKPLFEGYYLGNKIFTEPYIIHHKKKKETYGRITNDENHDIQLYLRYIVDFFAQFSFQTLIYDKEFESKDEKFIHILENMYVVFNKKYPATLQTKTTHKFNLNVVDSILNNDHDINYRVFFNFFINFKLRWSGTFYNSTFMNDFYSIKQELIHLKNE